MNKTLNVLEPPVYLGWDTGVCEYCHTRHPHIFFRNGAYVASWICYDCIARLGLPYPLGLPARRYSG